MKGGSAQGEIPFIKVRHSSRAKLSHTHTCCLTLLSCRSLLHLLSWWIQVVFFKRWSAGYGFNASQKSWFDHCAIQFRHKNMNCVCPNARSFTCIKVSLSQTSLHTVLVLCQQWRKVWLNLLSFWNTGKKTPTICTSLNQSQSSWAVLSPECSSWALAK